MHSSKSTALVLNASLAAGPAVVDSINVSPRPQIIAQDGPVLRIAGNNAFGQVVGAFAARHGIAAARQHGVAAVRGDLPDHDPGDDHARRKKW